MKVSVRNSVYSHSVFFATSKCHLLLILIAIITLSCTGHRPAALIITGPDPAPGPVLHGIQKLKEQLHAKKYEVKLSDSTEGIESDLIIITGLTSDEGLAIEGLIADGIALPEGEEAMVIHKTRRQGISAVILCGSDANGLMYALLDLAQLIGLSDSQSDILSLVDNVNEKADIAERGVSTYTMQRAWFEDRLYDEAYWETYFDQLAKSRLNSFVVIFGYENGGFMAPPYPYFFNTDGFPDVTMTGITPDQQKKNTEAFNRMITIAHVRGIKVTAGIWDHIYRGGVQSGGLPDKNEPEKPLPHLVWGVTTENLTAYSLKSIEKFLDTFPGIDGIQFRMHPESGLTEQEMPQFWHNVFRMIMEKRPDLQIDLRAKGLPDEIIDDAVAQGLKFRVATKYWMEQMGLPFHPTHVNRQNQKDRRHGYADLLKYPQKYTVNWRLWNGGTSRILLWGDPEYGRRFAESAHLFGGNSFEVNEPLATKMETQPQDAKPFDLLNPEYRYYNYEFERYWYLFDVFGRTGYNAKNSETIWTAEYNQRFGSEAGPEIRKGLHLASRVLPRIVASAYNYRYFPTTRGWAEKMHFGGLPEFSRGGGTDIQQFVSFEEQADNILTGADDPRTSVFETGRWFGETADSILQSVEMAEKGSADLNNKELRSAITDLKILGYLAKYYSNRVIAAVNYNLFKKTNSLTALDDAITFEKLAIDSWQGIIKSAGDFYSKDLLMGICSMGMCGDWSADLEQMNNELYELVKIHEKREKEPVDKTVTIYPVPVRKLNPTDTIPPDAFPEKITSAQVGKALAVTATVNDPSGIKWVRLRYRHVTQFEDYETLEMKYDKIRKIYLAEIPGSFIVPDWDVMYFIETMDNAGNGRIYPDYRVEAPYVIVKTEREYSGES